MQKRFFIIVLFSLVLSSTFAEVDPPNYNFSLDSLKIFFPGKNFAEIQKKYPKSEKVEGNQKDGIYKYYVAQIRYKFPVFVQYKNSQVVDFYARLPSYFLHDVFHQSMINRYGKQDQYFKKLNSAVYIWNNEDGIRFTYSGSCTINCFPMYLTGMKADGTFQGQAIDPLLNKFKFPQEKPKI
ncbi:hypothetical protein OAT67_08780 [Bacteriovoracaceae bacterium]|nr:hypothetical protein [Bacteriovoracaceae bacterium]|tara:strand:+ start:46830 stop:47375 length:546 start_codon:yes stop_codon:yes gene_type:complete